MLISFFLFSFLFCSYNVIGPAYAYQIVMNGCRLGFYDPIRITLTSTFSKNVPNLAINIVTGAICGATGALAGSPLFLVKTRMQSQSSHLAVGHQHHYKNTFDALYKIWRNEGIRGLYRGVDASIIRTSVGSSVQLPSYYFVKQRLMSKTNRSESDILLHCVASLFSGFCVCIAMNPFDVVSTRMYNQGIDLVSGKGR